MFECRVASLTGTIILLLLCSLYEGTGLALEDHIPFFFAYGHVFLAGNTLYSVGSAINNIFVICKLTCIVLRFVVCPRLTYFHTLGSVRVDKSSQDVVQ